MKLIRIFIALLMVTGTTQIFAKPNAFNNTEDRRLTGFHAVTVAGSFDVYLTQGNTESVKVEAPADVIKNIITEVKGGTLVVRTKDHFSWNNVFGSKKIAVYVSIKNCDGISLTGSGDIYFKQGIVANNLTLALTGSGDLTGKITAKNISSELTGSGDVRLSGRTENSKIETTGSGDFSARDLITNTTVVSLSGSGDAAVYASETIKASVTGSGDVHYSGHPKNVAKSKTGSGDINGN